MEYRDYEPYMLKTARIQRARVFAKTGLLLDESELMSDFNLAFLKASKSWQDDGSAAFTTYLTKALRFTTQSMVCRLLDERRLFDRNADMDTVPDDYAHLEPFVMVSMREAVDSMGDRGRTLMGELVRPSRSMVQGRHSGQKVIQEVAACTGLSCALVYFETRKAKEIVKKRLNFPCNGVS